MLVEQVIYTSENKVMICIDWMMNMLKRDQMINILSMFGEISMILWSRSFPDFLIFKSTSVCCSPHVSSDTIWMQQYRLLSPVA